MGKAAQQPAAAEEAGAKEEGQRRATDSSDEPQEDWCPRPPFTLLEWFMKDVLGVVDYVELVIDLNRLFDTQRVSPPGGYPIHKEQTAHEVLWEQHGLSFIALPSTHAALDMALEAMDRHGGILKIPQELRPQLQQQAELAAAESVQEPGSGGSGSSEDSGSNVCVCVSRPKLNAWMEELVVKLERRHDATLRGRLQWLARFVLRLSRSSRERSFAFGSYAYWHERSLPA